MNAADRNAEREFELCSYVVTYATRNGAGEVRPGALSAAYLNPPPGWSRSESISQAVR